MKKNLPDDWKAQVLDRIDKKTGFIDANGKRHYSPMYTWVKELFATPANDEKWVQLSERLPVNVLADALEVCRRALFNIPPRVFPWDNSAAVAKARKNAKELAGFLRKWDSVPWAAMPWVAETAEGLEGLVTFLERAGNPIQELADGKFDVGGVIMPEKPGQGRRPVGPDKHTKPRSADWRFWRATSMLDTFFRERFGPTQDTQETAALLLSIWDPDMYETEDDKGNLPSRKFKRMLRTIKKKKATPTPTPAHW